MPVQNTQDIKSLAALVKVHDLAQDPQWAIEGIAQDLNLTTQETRDLLVARGYLTNTQES